MDSGVMAAMIGAIGAVGAAAVTALVAKGTSNGGYSTTSSNGPQQPPLPTTWATVLRRTCGILLVGAGIGLLSAGAALFGETKGSSQGPVIGAIFIGWGSGFLASGVLTLLYRRLP